MWLELGTRLLCLCYSAVVINFTYYAHVKDLCSGVQYFARRAYSLKILIIMMTVLLEYIDL